MGQLADDTIAPRFNAIIHDKQHWLWVGLFGFLYYFALLLILRHTPLQLIFGKIRQVLMRSTYLGYTWVLSMSTDVLFLHDILTFFDSFCLDLKPPVPLFDIRFGIPLGNMAYCGIGY
jgi:hypothetical protein